MKYCFYILVLWANTTSAQSWETEVTQAPAGFNAYHIIEDRDGNYAVAGVQGISIGHFVFFLIKLDGDGNYIDHRIYHQSSPTSNNLRGLIEIPNTGYLLYGSKPVDGANQYDYFVFRTDYNGDTLWSKSWGSAVADEGLMRCVYHEGYLYFLGHSDDTTCTGPAEGNIRLIKTDTLCNPVWEKCYKYGYDRGTTARGLTMCPDGHLAIAGTATAAVGANPFLLKVNTDGDTIFYRRYLLDASGQGWGIASDSLNNLYLSGFTGSLNPDYPFDRDAFILKTDSLGNEAWKFVQGHQPGDDGFNGLQIKGNKLYGYGGWCGSSCWGLLACYDLGGNYIWGRVVDRSQTFWRDGVIASDGGLCATGLAVASGHAYAIKIDSLGNVPLGYTEPFTAVTEENLFKTVDISPNPFSDVLLIDITGTNDLVAIEIVNVLGRTVYKESHFTTKNNLHQAVDVSALLPGVYVLRITANGEQRVEKIVKQ